MGAAIISGVGGFGTGVILAALLAPLIGIKAVIPVMGPRARDLVQAVMMLTIEKLLCLRKPGDGKAARSGCLCAELMLTPDR